MAFALPSAAMFEATGVKTYPVRRLMKLITLVGNPSSLFLPLPDTAAAAAAVAFTLVAAVAALASGLYLMSGLRPRLILLSY